MKLRLISFTDLGSQLNQKLCNELTGMGFFCEGFTLERFSNAHGLYPQREPLSEWVKNSFSMAEGIIFIGACGVAVRSIAPFIKDKYIDPAVLNIDEKGKYCIPLLSGHVGGANELAIQIAKITDGIPIISTATDLNQLFAVDVFAKKNHLYLSDRELAKQISAELLEGKKVLIKSDLPLDGAIPNGIVMSADEIGSNMEICISIYKHTLHQEHLSKTLRLVPPILTLGIGCKKDTDPAILDTFVIKHLEKQDIDLNSIISIGSIDLKKEEKALILLAEKYGWLFETYSSKELKKADGEFEESNFVQSVTGVGNVCERAAVHGSMNGTLVIKKIKEQGMTLAIAKRNRRLSFE